MDRITAQYVSQFIEEAGLEELDADAQFEHFASYITVSTHLRETFKTDDIVIGGGGDTSIDAIAILVNGTLITELDALNDLAETSAELNVVFVFVQATRSSSFDGQHMSSFGRGVVDFFSISPTLKRNEGVSAAAELMWAVMDLSLKFRHGNPACLLYYVNSGHWQSAPDLAAHITRVTAELQNMQFFSRVVFTPVDSASAQQLFRKTKSTITRSFNFTNKITLPDVEGVTASYLGVLPASEYRKLLQDDDGGNIVRSLFYNNVRDWHGYDVKVNEEIKSTLNSEARDRFMLMNNGITIIARELRPLGNTFHIEDFSIVNGCQTSNVLFDQRDVIDDLVMVPLRLIHTNDSEIIKAIIHSTNFQTEIKREQFLALEDYPKQLEDYFGTFPEAHRLYFERRDRQYARMPIATARIVTLANMIKSYAAMFLNEPHRTTRNYSGLRAKVGTDIFAENHKYDPYYTSAFALYRLENLFKGKGKLEPKFKMTRFHMLMAVRMLGNPVVVPRPNSHEMEHYCATLNEQLWDVARSGDLFARAAAVINEATGGVFDRDQVRTEPFTAKVKALCRQF